MTETIGGYSYSDRTGDGTAVTFPFSFVGPAPGYIHKSDIKVYIRDSDENSGSYGEYTLREGEHLFPSQNTITIAGSPVPAPLDGRPNIRIRRIVDKTAPYADPNSDDIFRKSNLNNSFLQQLYAFHEALDGYVLGSSSAGGAVNNLNMNSFRIYNLADGERDTDAVNLRQLHAAVVSVSVGGPPVFESLRRGYKEAGYNLVVGSFEKGGTITDSKDVLLFAATGHCYSWAGSLPSGGKVVPENSTPDSSGGVGTGKWVDRTDESLRLQLASPTGAALLGLGDTTVGRHLDKEVFVDYFAPVLDYGPIITTAQETSLYGGTVKLRGERYPVLTSIRRRAGWTIEGMGVYATELYWDGGDGACLTNEQITLTSRSGKTIGNASGQYHTALKKLSLIGNGAGIGLWRRESWWDKVSEVIIEGFDIGEKDGIGTSNVTGSYWCVCDQVWYRNNRVNLVITDFSNLNTWRNCRWSHSTDWDIQFLEPTEPLLLGQQGNKFIDCEFAGEDSLYLGARIFDMEFQNTYFEQPGYAIYDATSHSKGRLVFTGLTNIFGSKSVKNKIVAGVNGGNCQDWVFDNIRTNLGKGEGAAAVMQVVEMGPTANYFHFNWPRLDNTAGWVLTDDANYSKTKATVLSRNGGSILFMKKMHTEESIQNRSHTVVDYGSLGDIGVDMYEAGVNVGTLDENWKTVMTVPQFVIQFAFATLHCELTICGRNPTFNNIHSAHICFEVDSVNGALTPKVDVYNRQTGTVNITVNYQLVLQGDTLLVQINNTNASPNNQYDQVYCAVEAKVAGKFPALCS